MSITLQDLIRNLTESGLLTEEEISTAHESIVVGKKITAAEDFARELVKENRLTKLQVSAVLKGKTKNLLFGEYLVLDKIGSGGMGQVFKARHRPTGKLVALKVLSAEAVGNRRLIERFKKEAKAIGRLKHPNIVRAYEAGKMNRIRYLVMEYVNGENMLARVKRKGPLAIDEVVNCILQAARGLDYAHQKGIIHRDIKPSNLLRDRRTGRVKVVDLGLARVEEPDDESEDQVRLTMAGQMLGTARFMAPEQIEDARKADVRSDIYSLACTMYYLLRGKAPYAGETVAHTLMAHVSADIPDLCAKRDDAPTWLGGVFNRMMAKKPKDRYQTMGALVEEIQRHLADDANESVLDDEPEHDDEYSDIMSNRDLGASIAELYIPADELSAGGPEEPDIPDVSQEEAPPSADLTPSEDVAARDSLGRDVPTGNYASTMAEDEVDVAPRRPLGFTPRGSTGRELEIADIDASLEGGLSEEEQPETPAASEEPPASQDQDDSTPDSETFSDSSQLSDVQEFDIGDDIQKVTESGVTDYVSQKLKHRQAADTASLRRYQVVGIVIGGLLLLGVIGWVLSR